MKKLLLIMLAIPLLTVFVYQNAEARGFSSSRSSRSSFSSSRSYSTSSPRSSSTASRSYSSSRSSVPSSSSSSSSSATANRSYSTPSQSTRTARSALFSNGGWGNSMYNSYSNGSFFNGYLMGSMFRPAYYGGGYYGYSPYRGVPSYGMSLGYASSVGGFSGGLLFFFIRMLKIIGSIILIVFSLMAFEEGNNFKGVVGFIILLLLLTI